MSLIDDLAAESSGADALRNYNRFDDPELRQRLNAPSSLRNYNRYTPEVGQRLGGAAAEAAPAAIADTARPSAQVIPFNRAASTAAIGAPAASSVPATIADAASSSLQAPAAPPSTGTSMIGRLAEKNMGMADVVQPRAIAADAPAAGAGGAAAEQAAARGGLRAIGSRLLGPAVAAAVEGSDVVKVARDPNSTAGDVAQQALESGAKVAGATVGGAALSPIPVVGPIAGAAAGYKVAQEGVSAAKDGINQLRAMFNLPPMDTRSPVDRIAQTGATAASGQVVPGANGSTVQVNGDGTAQLASRPTVAAGDGGGAGRGQVNPPAVVPATAPVATSAAGAGAAPTSTKAAVAAQAPVDPLEGAVQVIRPTANGVSMSWAIPSSTGMTEINDDTYGAVRQALDKNPGIGSRLHVTSNGPMIDGVLVPANLLLAAGDKPVNDFLAAAQQNRINQADPLAAAVRAKVAEQMGDAGIATGATDPSKAAGAAQLTGADFIKTLPPQRSALVKGVGEGALQVTQRLLTSNPGLLAQVLQAYPDFNQQNPNLRYQTSLAFAKGKQGDAVRAANQTISHMGSLYDAINELDNFNGVATPLNSIVNPVQKMLGDTRQGTFQQKANAVAAELRKVFAGSGGGSLAELEKWEQGLPVNASKDQQQAYLRSGVELLNGALGALQNQYESGMGTTAQRSSLLTPEAQETLAKITGEAKPDAKGGATISATSGPPVGTVVQGHRFKGGNPNDQKNWERVQ